MASARSSEIRVHFVDYVLDPLRPGASGLSDIVWDMAEELDRQGGEAHVFGPYQESPRPAAGVQLHPVPIPPPGYRNVIGHVAIVLAAYREIRRLRLHGVVHAPEYLSTGLLVMLSRDLPVVVTVPGHIEQKIATGTNPYDPTFTLALRITSRLSSRRCARVVATSTDMEEWWARSGTAREQLVLAPLGVDTGLFSVVPEARRALGLPEDRQIILAVGRINRENGFATLITALSEVCAGQPAVELHLVGDGPEIGSLKALAERLGVAQHVVWHGWVDRSKLAALYSAVDLFAFTALTAGLPRVVLEAMACGAPVVATTVPGVADHIQEGVTGYLVPPGDARALARKLTAVLRDDSQRMAVGSAARDHVRREVSWRAVMETLINRVYRPLLGTAIPQ